MRLLLSISVIAFATPAFADDPDSDAPADANVAPLTPVLPPAPESNPDRLWLLEVKLTSEITLYKGNAGDPISIAPDLSILTSGYPEITLIHSSEALTGFQGVLTGTSLCVAGDVCKAFSPHVYHDVGIEAGKVIRSHIGDEGEFNHSALAINAGIVAYNFDPFALAVKVGARASYITTDLVQAQIVPSVHIAVTERDTLGDRYYVPFKLAALPSETFSLELVTGIAGTFKHASESYQVPLGISVDITASKDVSVIAGFMFPAVEAGDAIAVTGFDARVATLALQYNKFLGGD